MNERIFPKVEFSRHDEGTNRLTIIAPSGRIEFEILANGSDPVWSSRELCWSVGSAVLRATRL